MQTFSFLCRMSVLVLVMACGNTPQEDPLQANANDHHHITVPGGEMKAPSDASLYKLETPWINHHGDSIALSQLQGKVQLVSLVCASCQDASPGIVADMQRIEEALIDIWGHQVGFVLVSIDPGQDTPEKLLEFVRKNSLNPHRWQLLRGSNDGILALAALLGMQYKGIDPKDFSHSNVITVLNPAGEIRHQQVGLGINPDQIIAVINQEMAAHMAKRSHRHH